jgi:hypothetical protein
MLIQLSPKIVFILEFLVSQSTSADQVLDTDNIAYYKCDVSKWAEVEAVSKKIVEEVCFFFQNIMFVVDEYTNPRSATLQLSSITLALFKEN